MQFRSKAVTIEAIQFTGKNVEEIFAFTQGKAYPMPGGTIAIPTPEGTMTASPRDWIIKGLIGEFYPCKPDVFAAKYEAV